MGVKLYIGNLPFGTTDQELQDGTVENFSSHGKYMPKRRQQASVGGNRFTGRKGRPQIEVPYRPLFEAYMEYVSTAKWREPALA